MPTPAPAGSQIAGILLVLATALGVVIGVAGPSTSPVAPGAPPVPVISGLVDRLPGLPSADAPRDPR